MEYEILVRKRGENVYAAYCPQLDLVVTGAAHAEVEEKMRQIVEQHKKAEAEKQQQSSSEKTNSGLI